MNEQNLNKFTAVLLCAGINDGSGGMLTFQQWHRLISYLQNAGLDNPHELLRMSNYELRTIIPDAKLVNRISALLKCQEGCVCALKRMKKHNIGVVAMDDKQYPDSVLLKLQHKAPPLLFTAGNISLFNSNAVAVTGSRNPSKSGSDFAAAAGKYIAKQGYTLVSGAANGCDTAAAHAAFENGGRVLLYLARPFFETINNSYYRKMLGSGRVCIATDHDPFGPFLSWQALRRNDYIYSNSDAAFVCECNGRKGGTFSGAKTALEEKLCPIYVNDDKLLEGNQSLINSGGYAVSDFFDGLLDTVFDAADAAKTADGEQ